MNCPYCQTELDESYICPQCQGRCVNLARLRGTLDGPDDQHALQEMWNQIFKRNSPRNIHCPGCRQPMIEAQFKEETICLHLDLCRTCQMIWFDPGEYEALPQGGKVKSQEVPLLAKQVAALFETQAQTETVKNQQRFELIQSLVVEYNRISSAIGPFGLYVHGPPKGMPATWWGLLVAFALVVCFGIYFMFRLF